MTSTVKISFSLYNGMAGEDLLHTAMTNDGRKECRLVGRSMLALWISRRILVRRLLKQYKNEMEQSLDEYEYSIYGRA